MKKIYIHYKINGNWDKLIKTGCKYELLVFSYDDNTKMFEYYYNS